MSGFTENVKTFNSVVRTVVVTVFVGIVGLGGYLGYTTFVQPLLKDRQALAQTQTELANAKSELEASQKKLETAIEKIEEQDETIQQQLETIAELGEQIEKLETAMRLLKVDHRLARIDVLSIREDPKTKQVETTVSLQEVDEDGNSIGEANKFVVQGQNIYVDFWLAKFEDKYIEENDLLRSTTICMFKSIYGENEAPAEATAIEKPWVRPEAYAGGSKMSDFEKKIWKDFWTIANDNSKSKELGIRANHGQAVYVKAEEGKSYLIELRASDGLSFKSVDAEPKEPQG